MKAALLIIDMQNDFVREGRPLFVRGAPLIIPAIQNVLEEFRNRSLPVFHVLRIHRPDGSDVEITREEVFRKSPFAVEGTEGAAIAAGITPLPGEYLLPKIRMSAFIGTGLDLTLRTLGVEQIIICGIQTPNCIRATAYDAIAYNYPVYLVTDAIAAKTAEIHKDNIRDMEDIGIGTLSASEVGAFLS